jgi:predicted DNA-binding transcriptional regulator AlpA
MPIKSTSTAHAAAPSTTSTAKAKPRCTAAQSADATRDDDALLRERVVLDWVGLGRSAWRTLIEQGAAPAPLKFGRNTRWRAGDVREWLRARIAVARAIPPTALWLKRHEAARAANAAAQRGLDFGPVPKAAARTTKRS